MEEHFYDVVHTSKGSVDDFGNDFGEYNWFDFRERPGSQLGPTEPADLKARES